MRWGMDDAEALARVRHKRATPPGLATKGDRRPVFDAALKQFDELLVAARTIGPSASPIPFFYSLSQAGRALSAAFTAHKDWEISGHGLKFSLRKGSPIGKSIIRPDHGKSDAFSLVSKVLGSDPLTSEVTLRQAWAAAPYMWAPHALGGDSPEPLRMTGETDEKPHVIARLDGEVARGLDEETRTEELRERLSGYPGAERIEVRGTSLAIQANVSIAYLAWPDSEQNDQPVRSAAPEMIDGGAYFLQPGLGKNKDHVHPLMVWWLILFALSSLARYHSAEWMAALDPAKSEIAVPIERALQAWSSTIPLALLHELELGRS